jgi:hypothetical protein
MKDIHKIITYSVIAVETIEIVYTIYLNSIAEKKIIDLQNQLVEKKSAKIKKYIKVGIRVHRDIVATDSTDPSKLYTIMNKHDSIIEGVDDTYVKLRQTSDKTTDEQGGRNIQPIR